MEWAERRVWPFGGPCVVEMWYRKVRKTLVVEGQMERWSLTGSFFL